MALSAAELALLEKKIKDIEKLSNQLGENFNNLNLRPLEKNITAIDAIFNDFTRRVHEAEDGTDYLVSNFKKLVGEIGRSNEGIKATQSGFKNLGSLAEKLSNHQKGYNNLSSEDVKQIKKKIDLEVDRLNNAQKILIEEERDLQLQKNIARARGEADTAIQNRLDKNIVSQNHIKDLINGQNSDLIELYNTLGKSTILAETFAKTMGLTGAAAGALKGTLNALGLGKLGEALGLDKAFEAASDKAKELAMIRIQSLREEEKLVEKNVILEKQINDLLNLRNTALVNINQLEGLRNAILVKVNQLETIINTQIAIRNDLEFRGIGAQIEKEKRLKDEIDAQKGLLSINQIRSGFGGTILKLKQAELDTLKKTNIIEKDTLKDIRSKLSTNLMFAQSEKDKLNTALTLLQTEKDKLNITNKQIGPNLMLLQSEKDRLALLQKNNAQYSLFSDKIKVMNTYFSQAAKGLTKMFSDPLFYIKLIFDAFKDLDKGIGQFAKSMNLSYQDAAKMNDKFNDIANTSNDLFVTTKGIRETMAAIGQSLGTNAILNAKDAVTFTKLREQAGFTNEELSKMQQLTLATGGNLEDNTKKLLGAASITAMNNGVLLNEKDIMKDIAATSDATKLSLGGSTANLGAAVAQAKALGMTLTQVDKIADSLLQIESSISAELEAELLTGKNLNLEGARLAALNNDMVGLSKELAKNYGTAAEYSKMNRLQQEAAAKAVGMSREELAGTLVKAEALKSMSGEQAELAKRAFDLRVKDVGLEQAQSELANGKLKDMMSQQSIQERFSQTIEKLKEVFISLAGPILQIVSPIIDLLIPALKSIVFILSPVFDIFKGISGILTGNVGQLSKMEKIMGAIGIAALSYLTFIKSVAIYEGLIKGFKISQLALEYANKAGIIGTIGALTVQLGIQLGLLSASMATNAAMTFGIGVVVAVAAALAGIAAIKATMANDMVSPGYGKRTLTGPEGTIALNDKDTVIAGTNLFGDDVKSEPNSLTEKFEEGKIKIGKENNIKQPLPSSPSIDYTALASAIVSALSASPMNVNVRGEINGKTLVDFIGNNATPIGTVLNAGTSKIA